MTLLISQVVDAITAAQENGFKPLAFVIPISEQALEETVLEISEIEDRIQAAIEREVKECLNTRERV